MLEKQSPLLPTVPANRSPPLEPHKTRLLKSLALLILSLALLYFGSSSLSQSIVDGLMSDNKSSTPQGWEYSVVEGFWVQDDPVDGKVEEAVLPRLGLIDPSPDRWCTFRNKISKLQKEASKDVSYKVIYLSRHGQGYHNVAESHYGTEAWNEHWSLLYTDNKNLTWGPDPLLTPLGKDQAAAVRDAWKTELSLPTLQDGLPPPLPEILWSSPLSRAAHTLNITYHSILLSPSPSLSSSPPPRPTFKENLRESIGYHTCDARSTSYYLRTTFSRSPQNPENPSNFAFEEGFRVFDERWTPGERESAESQEARTRLILDELFDDHPKETYIALVGHGGTISSFFAVTSHKPCSAPTGAFIPVVVKGVRRR